MAEAVQQVLTDGYPVQKELYPRRDARGHQMEGHFSSSPEDTVYEQTTLAMVMLTIMHVLAVTATHYLTPIFLPFAQN